MSKYAGCGAVIKKDKHSGTNTNGKPCVIEGWDASAKKYKVDFGNGFCGWYKLKELIIDKEQL